MNKKTAAAIGAGLLIAAGSIAAMFPGAGPAVGVGLHAAGEGLKQIGGALMDRCPREMCACDAKECGTHGPVTPLDGGATCDCDYP